jgi:hypothetical protein
MKLRSQAPWPKSFDFLHSLTLNCTPEGMFQAVRVLKPGTPEEGGEFEVMFEGSESQCRAYMERVVNQDRGQKKVGDCDRVP